MASSTVSSASGNVKKQELANPRWDCRTAVPDLKLLFPDRYDENGPLLVTYSDYYSYIDCYSSVASEYVARKVQSNLARFDIGVPTHIKYRSRAIGLPAEYQKLADYFHTKTHTDIYAYLLGLPSLPDAPELAQATILRAFDIEQSTINGKLIEIGIASIDPWVMRRVKHRGPHGINLLKKVCWSHYRYQKNAHLVNTKFKCKGDPENNRFNHTTFLTDKQATEMLNHEFKVPMPGSKNGEYRPVIVIGHDLKGDIRMLGKAFKLGDGDLGIVVAEIDTQIMAWETGVQTSRNKIGLESLATHLGVPYRDAHTACNDIATTVISATLIVLTLYPDTRSVQEPTMTVQQMVDEIESHSREQPPPKFGTQTYCLRCGSSDHLKAKCLTRHLRCEYCYSVHKHDMKKNGHIVRSHITAHCVSREIWARKQPESAGEN